jgi:hypothetical protein
MTTLQRIRRVGIWLLSNGITYLLLALGVIGFGWAWNVYAFLSWIAVLFFTALILAKAQDPSLSIQPDLTRPVPAILDIIIDFSAACVCVAFGHWFFGFLKLVEILEYQTFYHRFEEKPEVVAEIPERPVV